MELEEDWKECSTLYSRAKVVTEGGEDLLSCRALFSDDQRWLFVACGCHVKVISLSSREVVHILDRHTKAVTALAINPKNRMQLVTTSLDGCMILWDYTDGALLRVIDFSTPLYKFKFRPGGLEPSLYFLLQKDEKDYVVEGVSSHVITGRGDAVAPSDQLADAQQFLSSKKPNNFTFTHDGSCVVTFSGRKLLIYDIESETSYSYRSSHAITTVDCHPLKLCIATGNSLGEIQMWYDFARAGTKVVATTFHWHAHSVADVCFTSDGSYLLSGGEESVLVLWQLDSHKKQFRPRLGSPISKLSCCHGDGYFAASLQSNVICLLSGLDTEVEHTVGGLRKAYVQNPGQNGLKTGLVRCPRSNSLLLNSTPGLLQFYDPQMDIVTNELDIAYLNVVSRPDNKPLELTTVEHVAFSPDGLWLATVEARDDKKTAPELKMKLWEFTPSHQRYVLNTCIDPPHNDKVTDLTFQPPWKSSRWGRGQHGVSPVVHMAITTSLDGRFKSWVLVDNEGEDPGEEREGKKKNKRVPPSWACRSVGYYHNLPCLGAAFSQDGSLLALNFKKYVTVWNPLSCELLRTLNAPVVYEQFVHLMFGNSSSSQYLIGSTTTHLLVWNMLTCSVQWCIKAPVSHLVADPSTSLAVAFVPSDTQRINMYIFDPSSPTPLAVHKDVCPGDVVGAVFLPVKSTNEKRAKDHVMKSRLYFMDKSQVLYSLRGENEVRENSRSSTICHFEDEPGRRAFTEIFGDTKQGSIETQSIERQPAISHPAPKRESLLSAAPHVLPPMTLLCQHYLKSLLPSTGTESQQPEVEASDRDINSGSEIDSGGEEGPVAHMVPRKRQLNGDIKGTLKSGTSTSSSCSSVDYSWLIDCFKSHNLT